ncbi:major tail protein [Clostridium sp. YIM B02551]|uniref:major tail protein n=1 Tax=Clostridium sp. YIM B02551 TaxID=2910679 RepID=UPI001EEACF29|nr:major tail protein [Clostridium sp. YIM B02551]
MGKKITTGVNKAYYAIYHDPATVGANPTYDAVKYLQGLREISINAKEEQGTIYAENQLWDSESSLGQIDVTFDFTSIETEDYAALLGKKIATDGGIIENANDEAPYIAIMVEKTLSGGVTEYLTLFKGKLSIPEDKAKTKEGKTDYQTKSLSGIFMPLDNGDWKHFVKTSDTDFDKTAHDAKWGKEVVIPTPKAA